MSNKTSGVFMYLNLTTNFCFSVSENNVQPVLFKFHNLSTKSCTTTCKKQSYLIVRVGDGIGDEKDDSFSGMFIFNGAKSLARGGLGTRFGVFSFTNDVNRIFIFVEGNLKTPLKGGKNKLVATPS